MNWWGKVIGGALGFTMGPIGIVLGASIGHLFDKGMDSLEESGSKFNDVERIQAAFFTAAFSIMGYVAKADGKVTSDEIELASSIMDRMELDADKKKFAQELFRQGKQSDFPLDDILEQFRQECHSGKNLIQMFMEVQLSMVMADGVLHPAESEAIYHIGARLGYTQVDLDSLLARMRAETEYSQTYGADYEYQSGQAGGVRTRVDDLDLAFKVLGLTAQASDEEVKKSYRRLINQHHPDKLVSKGLPEEMMELAKTKSQEITAAYKTIKDERKF